LFKDTYGAANSISYIVDDFVAGILTTLEPEPSRKSVLSTVTSY
jgi:hypothetical protein